MCHIRFILSFGLFILLLGNSVSACTVLYYVDSTSGDIYVVNNEDYWLDTKAYIQIEPGTNQSYARLWYGWDNFAQGGVNEKGLFFDGAVTPEQKEIAAGFAPQGNLGDRLLANCANVEEALDFLKNEKVALNNAHLMIGDANKNAVVIEWVLGEWVIVPLKDNYLLMTNFLLSDTSAGNYPCYRYQNVSQRIKILEQKGENLNLLLLGNTFGAAAQSPGKDSSGRMGGTLYTSFINLTQMRFYLSYQLSNEKVIKLDLKKEFSEGKRQKIKLYKL